VRQILSFARKQDVRKQLGDIRPVIEEAIVLVRHAVAARSQITARLPPIALDAMFDPTQLHQVVVNLVTNAVHAKATAIEVRAEAYEHAGQTALDLPEGPYIQITVTDCGVGMDEATLARIFDPFFTTKSPDEGTGLGLSIVHEIVRGHGGAITVRSRVGEGTTFDVYLPRAGEERTTLTPGRGERVMLVDDEQAIVFLGKRILTKLGYRVTAYDNPHRALEELRANPASFDAVISDLAMPGMSGIAFLTAVRELRPDIAVILMSNYALAADIESARERGLGDVIPKPHTLDELAWALSRRLPDRVPK
jgi:CheY-like chemotaxis protein